MTSKNFVYTFLCFFLTAMFINAQQVKNPNISALAERTGPAPESVFKKFRDAGMDPVEHKLTYLEREKLNNAFAILPPLHQKILKKHLHSISFMDNMPNTALTSPVETSDSVKMYNITFRAEILNQTISEWTTWKENSCYEKSTDSQYQVTIEAGNLDAIIYVLLHEATHVLDGVLNLTPHLNEKDVWEGSKAFTQNVWDKYNEPSENVINPLLETVLFRSGKPIEVSYAPEVYKAIQKTPFVSLYSTASWFEDLAEALTIYHLTEKMKQPYKVVVLKNGIQEVLYEPSKNKRVKKRQNQLQIFYT
ncbi:hypothetical protein [Flavobacterium johnsoniae]|uniref:Secreted protein n=1 Tax=Flavobacterium johnsoniae TaxID=986 RepID=A0A1J7CEF5_FLAJO|nr:hypothetical protein [Flavobacterium johnsoniae]OIV39948.1 hypothetical protein BKM63_21330 [Flavobacterium johnsoniae]